MLPKFVGEDWWKQSGHLTQPHPTGCALNRLQAHATLTYSSNHKLRQAVQSEALVAVEHSGKHFVAQIVGPATNQAAFAMHLQQCFLGRIRSNSLGSRPNKSPHSRAIKLLLTPNTCSTAELLTMLCQSSGYNRRN